MPQQNGSKIPLIEGIREWDYLELNLFDLVLDAIVKEVKHMKTCRMDRSVNIIRCYILRLSLIHI